MNQKTLLTLGVATLAAVAATVALQAGRDNETRPGSTEARLLPALEQRVNDVREIRIVAPRGTATLRAVDAGWTLTEAAEYPADGEKVRGLLLDLRNARRREAKTANPERHARLGLVDPTGEGASSVRVTLCDADGAPIETLLVGKQRTSRAEPAAAQMGVTPGAQYYALPGEGPQTFLASGNLGVDGRTLGWLNQEFINIDRSRIAAATITHPDGQRLTAVREDMEQSEMVVQDLPEGMVPKSPSGTAQLVGALQRVRFDDVRRADSLEWPAETLTTAMFTTEGGLQVSVDTVQVPAPEGSDETVTWARLAFAVQPETEGAAEEDAAEEGDTDSPPSDDRPSRDALQAEVAALEAATAGWAYAVPAWKENSFRLRMEAVTEPAPQPEPDPEPQLEVQPDPGSAPTPDTAPVSIPLEQAPPDSSGGL